MFARLPSFGAWLVCAALPNMARAETSAPRKPPTLHVGFDAWEDARQGFDLDAEGERADSELVGSARLRTGFDARLGGPKLRLVGELDFFARRLHGVPEATGPVQVDPAVRTRDPFHPFPLQLRRLYLDWTTWLGVVRLGTQTSQWGLGILANAGERDDRLFGEPTRGNVSQRLLFATSPFQAIGASPTSALGRFTLLAAGDLVVADETAELLDTRLAVEDEAWQAVVSAFIRPRVFDTPALRPRTDVSGGLYAARRWQTYAEGDTLDVWVVDGHLRLVQDWEGQNRIRYEMEFAQLFGETDRVLTEGGPKGVDVEGLGAAAELAWAFQIGALPAEVQVTVGMASGDGDADDGTLQRFAFHGDYDVGLVLFDHVVPALQLRATENVDVIVEMIEGLVSKGNAYEKDGSFYFDVGSFEGYGKLARLDFDNMQDGAGEGGGITDPEAFSKKNSRDFALWKAYKEEDATVVWDTRIGRGMPVIVLLVLVLPYQD